MPDRRKPSPKGKSREIQAKSANPAIGSSLADALMQSTGAGIYIVQDHKFSYVSPFFERLSGYSLPELDGKTPLDLVHPDDRDSVKNQAVKRLKEGPGVNPYEYRFVKKNGDIMWVMERITSIDYMGQRAALGSFMDINQRKELEKALAESEWRHRAILDQMHDACFEVDLAGKFVYTNSFMCRSLHYKRDELIGHYYHTIIPESDAPAITRVFRGIFASGNAENNFSHRVKRKDGVEFYVESSVSLIRGEGGKATGFICVGRDISERKQLEKALVRSEERFRSILDRMHDSYFEVDLAGNFTFINEATSRHLWYTREELIGNSYKMIMSQDEAQRVFEVFHQVFMTGEPNLGFAHKVTRKDGTTGYAESSVSLLKDERGNPVGFHSVSRDITTRKLLEESLVQSEERYRTILEEMYDSYYEVDLAGNFVFVNDAVCTNLDYTQAEIIGQSYALMVPHDEAKILFAAFNQVFVTGQPNKGFTHRVRGKDGTTAYAETSVALRKNAEGRVIGFRSISRDVTERKKLEEALRRSEERFRTVLENMQDSYFEVDLAGNFTFINISASDRLGYSRDELLGKNYRVTTATDDLGNVQAAFNEVYRTGIPNRCFVSKSVCRDGSIVIVESSIGLLKNEQGEVVGFNSVGRDITEHKALEQQLSDMATHDFLTGLPNRLLLTDRLHMALAQAHRNKNKLAILTLDLDRFKAVNDTHGHHVGDELLKAIGQRLTGIIRSGDTVARMGGDEFLLLMPELHQSDGSPTIIGKIVEAFKAPFIIEGHRLHISASIGVAVYPDDGTDMEALMRKSDSAMYDIKRHGPSQVL